MVTNEPPEEGWYTDPYGLHEARWFSDGTPTSLVRDGSEETYDEPPNGPPIAIPQAIEHPPQAQNGEDLRRADEAEREDYDSAKARSAVSDVFNQIGPNI